MKTMLFTKIVRTTVAVIFILGVLIRPNTTIAGASADDAFISADTGGNTIYGYMWPMDAQMELNNY